MFQDWKEVVKQQKQDMIKLLSDNQTAIREMLSDKSIKTFKLFGDHIPDTASGMAKINVLISNAELGYLDIVQLQKSLQKLLSSTVNIYTEETLRDPSSELQADIILADAKTLEEILELEPEVAEDLPSARTFT